MSENQKIIFKNIEDKTITWFENSNQYLVLENQVANIIDALNNEISVPKIADQLSEKLNIPKNATNEFVSDIKKNIFAPNSILKSKKGNNEKKEFLGGNYEFIKIYKVNNLTFKVSYQGEYELYFVHPKFAHLEVKTAKKIDHHFEVFTENGNTFLNVDDITIGNWNYDNIHYFQGKFSMKFTQKIHQKEEKKWLGVFHASAVSNGQKSILFLGDSGNGKSTSLALLQANDFTCLADDFVPMDLKNQEIYSFPAAISIKKNSLPVLLPLYPELQNSAEFYFKRLNKIVRYLKPNNSDYFAHQPCNDLIFIKYKKDSNLNCEKISKLHAFEQLIPDSWLSPIKENSQTFLNWFENLNCYQLTYSNNEKMIETVHKIFNNEL